MTPQQIMDRVNGGETIQMMAKHLRTFMLAVHAMPVRFECHIDVNEGVATLTKERPNHPADQQGDSK